MPTRRVLSAVRRLAPVVVAAAVLAPTATAAAAVGADDHAAAAPLLFSVPGTVANNSAYTTQAAEPVAAAAPCPAMIRTAWWRIAGNGQTIDLSSRASNFDTVLAVYDAPAGVPILGNRVACNDNEAGFTTSQLQFTGDRGKSYLVQVGSKFSDFGAIDLRATSVRPPNDDRIDAQALATGAPATVSNVGASQELGEVLTCGPASYAATMWFRWSAPALGDVVLSSSAAFGDTVLNLYRASDGVSVGCAAGSVATVAQRVSPGEYLVQVGTKGSDVMGLGVGPITTSAAFTVDVDLDNDGDLASTDCNDANPAIRHGAAEIADDGIDQNCDGADAINLDRDADGTNRPLDCNDADPKIHPGVRDIPGNKIDEDCTDGPAPYPQIASTVRSFATFPPLRFTTLAILRAVKGSRIELRCQGRNRGCFKRKVIRVRASRRILSLLPHVRRARIKRGAVVEVRITKPGHVGFMRRITVRAGNRAPRIDDLCLPVGKRTPRSC